MKSTVILVLLYGLLFGLVMLYCVGETNAQAPHGTASEETPKGTVDGVNATFTLNFQPLPWGSIHVFRNGLRQQRNFDYTLGGPNHMQIIFNPCCIPQPGPPVDTLLADYTY